MKANNVLLSLLFLGSSSLIAQEALECTTIPNRNGFEWIENVKIGSLDYTSGKSKTRSDDFSEQKSIGDGLEAGDHVNFELTPGYKKRHYEEYWRIWIDINQDNVFSDSEIVFEEKGIGTISGHFVIPEGGNGDSKVKVAMNWKTYPSCENHSNGEIEYYAVGITPSYIGSADFKLPAIIPVISVLDNPAGLDLQGLVNNSNKKLTINIPYTNGNGVYSSFTGDYVQNNTNTGKDGDINSFRITYPAGSFDPTGSIPVTIEIDGDETFDAKQVAIAAQETLATLDFKVNGQSIGNIDLKIIGGIPDRNFADANHKFIYLPITAPDGRIWLNNNLGANYSNVNNIVFNPSQTAVSLNDYNAYGSLFQWGRYSDGHELINHTATGSIAKNSFTVQISPTETPGHNKFINSAHFTSSTVPLWNGENGINNPCPIGYRVPNEDDLTSLKNYDIQSDIVESIPLAGLRDYSQTHLMINLTGFHSYLKGVINSTNQPFTYTREGNSRFLYNNIWSGHGMSVRCIKD